jgi:hypothetical protein
MKRNHTFDLSILALAVFLAFSVHFYPYISKSCPAFSDAPYVTASVTSDTLTAAAGTRLPLTLSILNEGVAPISGGTVYLTVTHNRTGALVYNDVVKANVSMAGRSVSTSSVFWNIPSRLYGSVYTIQPLFVLDGYALKGTVTSTSTPFGNVARISVSGEKDGTFPSPYNSLPEYAQYSDSGACAGLGLIPSWAMAIGGLGVLMLVIAALRKKS